MCGIAGYIHNDLHRPAQIDRLRRMTDSIAHRGPDGEGFHVQGNLALGNRRLAVIDLATGDQPKYNDDSSIALVFNGEIYNYIELRDELKGLGHRFRTSSDTEVVVRAYEQWGTACQTRFNGMWAFALWDGKQQRLFCSRDRLGEKPFFYTTVDNTFVFGSEIKALFAYGAPRTLNTEMLDAYLCFSFVPAPYTMFGGIWKLPPGCSLVWEAGRSTVSHYWDVNLLHEEESRKDERAIIDEFEHLLTDAVLLRMRSDVPYGAFLSGGLDSGSIVSIMSGLSAEPVKTCTIGFEGSINDERAFARLVAEHFKTDHVERVVHPEDAEALLEKLAWHYDEPFGDTSALPTYLVSKVARERVTVVLTGDGGDEVLSGYTIHQGEKFASQFARLPRILREEFISSGLGVLSKVVHGTLGRNIRRADHVVRSANMDFIDRLEAKQSGLPREVRGGLLQGVPKVRPARGFIEEAIKPVYDAGVFTRLNYWLLKVSLPDDMLCKVDRASMANSLEARVPFLDHRLVDLLAGVSMDVKMRAYTRKHILRQSVGRKLPEPLLKGPKKGFNIPLENWASNGTGHGLGLIARRCARTGLLNERAVDAALSSGTQDQLARTHWLLAMLSYAVR